MSSKNIHLKRHRRQRGFTLIETLVAMVVMAVGMLGIAALYIEGLRSGQASVARTTAVTLAADMADRIRANPTVPASYVGVSPGAGGNNQCVNGPGPCTPAQVAQDDWFWWRQDVQARLPGGAVAQIAINNAAAAPAVQYSIQLSWPEPGQAAPATYNLQFAF